jgi:hypothetical protein
MTPSTNGQDAAWLGWSRALVSMLFPAGLGSAQHFAFGQTTLLVDFADADAQIANAEVFRIGDAMPAATSSFVPSSSLSDAYRLFLQRANSPQLASALADMAAADSLSQSALNMPVKTGSEPPAGSTPGTSGSALPTTFVPAYQLDAAFRLRYQEWQAASSQGLHGTGGVIRFCTTPDGSGAAAPALSRSIVSAGGPTTPAAVPPPFLRVSPAVPAVGAPRVASVASVAVPVAPLAAAITAGPISLEVSFTGLGTFMLSPGRWFNAAAVQLFAGQLSPADRALFFGVDGVLARRVYQVVVGFEPAVRLEFDDPQAFEAAVTHLGSPQAGSIGVGPFDFNAGTVDAAGGDTLAITLGPAASTLPILLGVVCTDVANPAPVG